MTKREKNQVHIIRHYFQMLSVKYDKDITLLILNIDTLIGGIGQYDFTQRFKEREAE